MHVTVGQLVIERKAAGTKRKADAAACASAVQAKRPKEAASDTPRATGLAHVVQEADAVGYGPDLMPLNGKTPLFKNWPKVGQDKLRLALELHMRDSPTRTNLGLRTNNLLVLDIDGQWDEAAFAKTLGMSTNWLAYAVVSRTPGGYHVVFNWAAHWPRLKNLAKCKALSGG